MIVDGSSTDRTREIALEKDVRVHLEPRKGYGRAYRTGFVVASNDIIVTMDADCTYPAELIPELVKRLLDDDLDFITAIASAWLKTVPCQAFTDLATGFSPSTLDFSSVMESKILNRACGCSASRFLIIQRCVQPMTECLSLKKSRFLHESTLVERRPSKSRSLPRACW